MPSVSTVTDDTESEVASHLRRRRAAAAEAWNLSDEIVLVAAGEPVNLPGRGDIVYPFRAHSEYFYLTDRERAGGVLAFDPREGWTDFVAPVGARERTWLGTPPPDPGTHSTDELPSWLARRRACTVIGLGAMPGGVANDAGRSAEARAALNEVRLPKDAIEVRRMRVAARAMTAAFEAVTPLLSRGTSERQVQIELEAEVYRCGADALAFDTVVGSGENAAALHGAPSGKGLAPGELVLIDAGCEFRGYASDITRTFGVDGALSGPQRALYSVVHAAERAAIGRCCAGTQWREVHLTAARVIAEGLLGFGILRGQVDALIESEAVWLFFPHGVGHLLGLGVRDVGGTLPTPEPPGLPNLRIDLALRRDMAVTVEPGIYFVRALLEDPRQRHRHRGHVRWDQVDRWLDFGGIRIEDDVLVTDAAPDVLTAALPVLPP